MKHPKTIDELLNLQDVPVVAIDQESLFTFINTAFVKEYGWTKKDLIGKSVGIIMPDHMRSAHNVGFSRFLTTEHSVLLGHDLPLKVLYKNGQERLSTHYILGEKMKGCWRFGAIIDYPMVDAR